MPPLRRCLLALLTLVALLGSSAGCDGEASSSETADAEGPLEAGGVRVSASFQDPSLVRVRFEPLQPGFHIYSLTLPAGGVDGLGIPTRVEAGDGLAASAPARSTVDSITLRIPELEVTLPVYPDGPVDILLPVEDAHPRESNVVVTYGACSDDVCLLPVRDLKVPVAS